MGINCHGSSQCDFTTVGSRNIMKEFNDTAWNGHDNNDHLPGGPLLDLELWQAGEHIICAENVRQLIGSVCLFLEGDNVPKNGVPGYIIKRRINDLLYHGCKFCGSVPILGNNRASDAGVLTANYVTDKGCQGLVRRTVLVTSFLR